MSKREIKFAEFADRFKEACDFAELEYQELAKRIGVSRNTISAYAAGVQMPNGEKLVLLAEALGISLDWLLLGRGRLYEQGVPYFPKMIDGSSQDRIGLGYEYIEEFGEETAPFVAEPDHLAWMVFQEIDYRFAPDWCLAFGDWVLIDTSRTEIRQDDIYLLEFEPEGGPRLRPVLVRHGSKLLEASWGAGGVNRPFQDHWKILGRALGRSSPM